MPPPLGSDASNTMKNLYAALGVASFADADIVETAYRSLLAGAAMTDERRQEIEQAYKVLADPASRAIYDQALRGGAPERLDCVQSSLLDIVKERTVNLVRHSRSVAAIVALVIALPIAASMLISSRMDKEREQLRIQREQETQQRAQQAEAEARAQEAQRLAERAADQQQREADAIERKNKAEAEAALREARSFRNNLVEQELAERQRKAEQKERERREEEELKRQNDEEAKRRLQEYQQILRGDRSAD